MTSYAIPGAPRLHAPTVSMPPAKQHGPLVTALVNVPALTLLLMAVVLLCAGGAVVMLARHALHH
jgi:hypothetical protein